jgi:hypothetical protein
MFFLAGNSNSFLWEIIFAAMNLKKSKMTKAKDMQSGVSYFDIS